MKYTTGSIGRVILIKFENQDIILDELKRLVIKERIKAATFFLIGALREGKLVTGPKKAVIPPVPNWVGFKDGWETMGVGTVFVNKKGPQIHLHVSMGKKNRTFTGCLREASKVFLVIEAVLLELKGIKATKDIDPKTGLNLLKIL